MKKRIHINGLVYVGGIILVYGSMVLFKAYGSHQWPITNGVILSSEVTVKTRTSPSQSGPSKKTTSHIPRVLYEYSVNKNTYSSARISFGPRNGDQAQQTVNFYPAGKNVQVYFNPDNPAESVLENEVSLATCVPFTIGLLIIAFGIYGTYKSASQIVDPTHFNSMHI